MALVGTAVSLGGVWALFTQRNAHIRPFATPVFPRLWHSHIKLTSGRPPMHLLFLDVRGHNLFISDHIFFFSSFPLLSSFYIVIHCVRFFSSKCSIQFATTLIRREYFVKKLRELIQRKRKSTVFDYFVKRCWFDEKISFWNRARTNLAETEVCQMNKM